MAAWLQVIALDRDDTGSLMAFRCGARQVKWAYRLLHFLPIRLRLKGGAAADQYGVPHWNFCFSRTRKCALAKKFSHAETFDVGLLYFWPVGQRYLGVNPLPRSRYLRDFCVCFFSQSPPDFHVAGILPSLSENFLVRKTFSLFVQSAEQAGPGGGLLRFFRS